MRQLAKGLRGGPGGPLNHWVGGRGRSVYADLRVAGSWRAAKTPRWARHHRPRILAWAGLTAFNRNRFYEVDRFYKARIDYPQDAHWPDLRVIDPDDFSASLEQRLAAEDAAARLPHEEPVDIGLPFSLRHAHGTPDQLAAWATDRAALESKARHRELDVDVEAALDSPAALPLLLRQAAEHYAVFRDLFHPHVYFHPVLPLDVSFPQAEHLVHVHCGNLLKPSEAQAAPEVVIEPRAEDEGALWTLLAVNPDGNPFDEGRGLLHWFVANIPASGSVADGEELVSWLPPLPFQGTGYHRLVFTLFRQDRGRLEGLETRWGLDAMRDGGLEARSWDQPAFVKGTEEEVTAAGLAFAQTDYDLSVKDVLHRRLGMEEPVYDYDWPPLEPPAQEEFPWDPQPVHKYLDAHIPKDVSEEEVLRMRLELQPPVGEAVGRPEFPNLLYDRDMARLNRLPFLQRRRERLGTGRFRGLYENRIN